MNDLNENQTATPATLGLPPEPPAARGQIPDSRPRPRTEANRRNARRSTGPKDTARTRFNATKHGLRAAGLTSLDDPDEHRDLLAALGAELRPVGTLETFLAESVALGLVRIRRARRLEAEHVEATRNRPGSLDSMLRQVSAPGGSEVATLTAEAIAELADGFVRYESGHASLVFKALRELRELQRARTAA
jgi:hypothetical protein